MARKRQAQLPPASRRDPEMATPAQPSRRFAEHDIRGIKMARKRQAQLLLPVPATWGGRRAGAGRRPRPGRPSMPHDERPAHVARHPVQVTLRAAPDIRGLRTRRIFPAVQSAIARSSTDRFRVVHFSVQQDHLHLIVEGDERVVLRNGIRGLAIRIALAVNRLMGRRGSLFADRYHARALKTPREMRASLVYVLLNFRKHLHAAPAVDPCSSGAWFDGWTNPPPRPAEPSAVRPARTWLAAIGWRRGGGMVDVGEGPASSRRQPPPRAARVCGDR